MANKHKPSKGDTAANPYSSASINVIKRRVIGIAKDLCYPESAIKALKNAKSEAEISNIMADARNGRYK